MTHMKETTPEKKSVKTLKGQLFGAVSMMLVAAIALGTSTYAWFINNRTVEVQNMQLTVSTSTSLLVAVGKKAAVSATDPMATADLTTNWTGDKSLVTNQDITGIDGTGALVAAAADAADWHLGNTAADRLKQNLLSYQMTPASVSNRGLTATAYGTTPALTFFATDNHVANGKLDQFFPIKAGITANDVGMGPVKRIPFKFSASSDLDVYFGKSGLSGIADMVSQAITAKMVTDGVINPITTLPYTTPEAVASAAQATAIRTALRVAIVPQKTDTYTDVKPVIFQFDAGTAIAGHGNNTDYQHLADVSNIFPNPDTDIAASGSTLADQLSAIQKPLEGKYAAIKAIDWSGNIPETGSKHITNVAIQQAELPATTKCWATVTGTDGSASVVAPASGTPLFQLKASEARMVDVYIWLEGADEDCLNVLSGFAFNLNLPFCAIETPTT